MYIFLHIQCNIYIISKHEHTHAYVYIIYNIIYTYCASRKSCTWPFSSKMMDPHKAFRGQLRRSRDFHRQLSRGTRYLWSVQCLAMPRRWVLLRLSHCLWMPIYLITIQYVHWQVKCLKIQNRCIKQMPNWPPNNFNLVHQFSSVDNRWRDDSRMFPL